jgi:hypothetical protein
MRRAYMMQGPGATIVTDGAYVYWRQGWPTLLPSQVLPLGFMVDSLVAAGVILAVVEGPREWRRRVRRAKGRCGWCGYDRAGMADGGAACPECGRVDAGRRVTEIR